jgi:hypothetical protein
MKATFTKWNDELYVHWMISGYYKNWI